MADQNEIKETVVAVQQLVEGCQLPRSVHEDSIPYVIIRDDQNIVCLEKQLNRPLRKTGKATFTRAESFISYVNQHLDEATRIYVPSKTQLLCVFNGHGEDAAGWGDFQAVYDMISSEEWKFWTGNNTKRMGQKEFGTLIEDHLEDIADPPSADLLEMVRQFEATSTVEYKSFDRGTDGNFSVSYVQTTQSKAGQKGTVELPQKISLSIPAFEGGERHSIVAKLRFSLDGGRLALWYELQRVNQILDGHIESVVAKIEKETEIEVFYGSPGCACRNED